MKFAISIFSMLLVVVGAMLFVQYQVYSDQDLVVEKDFYYTQEIEIEYRGDSLDIRHHFKNLPKNTVQIIWPSAAVDTGCFLEQEHSCNRLNETKVKFEAGENHAQSLSYVIPLNGQLQTDKMLEDVFAQLNLGDASYTTVHITTDPTITGTWITGLPIIGQQQLSLVNYTMFAGEGNVQDLYWMQQGAAYTKKTDMYSVYSKDAVGEATAKVLENLSVINKEHIAVVQTQNKPNVDGYRIVFVSELTDEAIQYRTTVAHIHNVYAFKDVPNWVKQVIASVLAGQPFGEERALLVFEELQSKLTDEQLDKFKSELQALEQKEVTIEKIDNALSNVMGTYTKFFTLNNTSDGIYPLVYNDRRPIELDGKTKDNLHVILAEGAVLYPADALLKELGYNTSVGPNGYYVTNEGQAYRFPEEEHGFYVYNNKRFNINTTPFQSVAGIRYVEETWVQRLFSVNIEKYDDKISITTTAQ